MPTPFERVWYDLQVVAELHAERQNCSERQAWWVEPGLHALTGHRIASHLWQRGWIGLARWVANFTRRHTGIDIHPAARLGRRCMLLQGGNIVVGETAVIGDDCVIEPGVMLTSGGIGVERPVGVVLPEGAETHRIHPSVGHRVVLEAGAILVGDVYVGDDTRVFAGAVVTRDVPDRGVAVGAPGRVLPAAQVRPDPDAKAIQALAERFYKLEEQVQVVAFQAQRGAGPGHEPWRTRQPESYGPIPEVESLIDGAGI